MSTSPDGAPKNMNHVALPRCTTAALLLLTAIGWAIAPAPARAAGNESTRRAHDLTMTVDWRWAGGANGGYYPIRIRLTNTARPRLLHFRFVDSVSDDSRLPTVDRQIQVDQNSTAQFSLSVPLVAADSHGELRVYEGGRLIEEFTQIIGLPDKTSHAPDRPALLVIHSAPAAIDCSKFEEAVKFLNPTPTAGAPWGGGYSATRDNDFQVIAPAMLPESWLDYTTLDIVAIPLAVLAKIPAAARTPLFDWTETGGTLVITEVGEPAAQSKELARLLNRGTGVDAASEWQNARPGDKRRITLTPEIVPGAVAGGTAMMMPGMAVAGAPPVNQSEAFLRAQEEANAAVWKVDSQTFSRLDLLAGRVYAFPDNPFPGATGDWTWWLESADWSNRLRWTSRLGNSTRERHPEFFTFLVPGVGAVPVVPFMILITLFAILIGPVNYFLVLRRKQLYLLVLTIPAIAFITSCSLFGYAVVADGFGVKSRLRSFTMLDQRTKQAVSFNRISLYAGMAPSSGLKFSHETAVLPIWQDDTCFEAGTMDWSDKQALTAGWLRSRTPAQFQTIVHRTERGRVAFTPAGADGVPEAANGLEWEIEALVVRDEEGRLFAGEKIPAGGTLRLHLAEDKDFNALQTLLNASRLEAPPGAQTNEYSPFSRRSRRAMMSGYYYGSSPTTLSVGGSMLERGLVKLKQAKNDAAGGGLAPRSYLATFRENPGIELGIEGTTPKSGVHALLGTY